MRPPPWGGGHRVSGVGLLVQKRAVLRMPGCKPGHPLGGLIQSDNFGECIVQLRELFAWSGAGSAGQMPVHIALNMHQTALDSSLGPRDFESFGEACSTIDHHDCWGWDAG